MAAGPGQRASRRAGFTQQARKAKKAKAKKLPQQHRAVIGVQRAADTSPVSGVVGGRGVALGSGVGVKAAVQDRQAGVPLARVFERLIPGAAYEDAVREATDLLQAAAARALGPTVRAIPFGSILQGAHLPGSDLDICVDVPGLRQLGFTVNNHDGDRHTQREVSALKRIMSSLGSRLSVVETRFGKRIRVPIVILNFKSKTGDMIEVDVSVGSSLDGLEKGRTDRLIRRLLAQAPNALPFVRLIKQWAKREGLNKAFDGFLNSMGWTLLVLYFLIVRGDVDRSSMHNQDVHEHERIPPPHPDVSESEVPTVTDLAEFFEMVSGWGVDNVDETDTELATAISLIDGRQIEGPPQERAPLFLEDPGARLDGLTENVARALRDHTWLKIQKRCKDTAKFLRIGGRLAEAAVAKWVPGEAVDRRTIDLEKAAVAKWVPGEAVDSRIIDLEKASPPLRPQQPSRPERTATIRRVVEGRQAPPAAVPKPSKARAGKRRPHSREEGNASKKTSAAKRRRSQIGQGGWAWKH
eukprot:TRINITY_DN6008_c0_g1_i1.p1 TRINITY_DN6008_c0_g1~~TRINITY_DN6008_c0_g1_i1.p1  ORF type:complete len:525 (+),score=98.10 TRINITY_DN6008_c0_g1_i1:138-1712(+)